MAGEPEKSKWRSRIVTGVIVVMGLIVAFERWVGVQPGQF